MFLASECLMPVIVPNPLLCGPSGRKRQGAVVRWRGESDRLRNTLPSYSENLVPYVRDLKPSCFLYDMWYLY